MSTVKQMYATHWTIFLLLLLGKCCIVSHRIGTIGCPISNSNNELGFSPVGQDSDWVLEHPLSTQSNIVSWKSNLDVDSATSVNYNKFIFAISWFNCLDNILLLKCQLTWAPGLASTSCKQKIHLFFCNGISLIYHGITTHALI